MAQIQQVNPLPTGQALIDSVKLQFDLNQLFATINALDANNLNRSGSEFDWLTTKLSGLVDPSGIITDSTDLQVAATKGYIKAQLFAAGGQLDPATGNWHMHSNKAILDVITDGGSGIVISAAERANLPTSDQKAAMDGAASPDATNVFATMNDIVTGVSGANQGMFVLTQDGINGTDVTTIPKSGLAQILVELDYYMFVNAVGTEENTIKIGIDIANDRFSGRKFDKTAYPGAIYSYTWTNQGITAAEFNLANLGGVPNTTVMIYDDATNIYVGVRHAGAALDKVSCFGHWVGTEN